MQCSNTVGNNKAVSGGWKRYWRAVDLVWKRFGTHVYRSLGYSVKYHGEADRRRVLELSRRIHDLGLGFEEGIDILLSFWTAALKSKPGKLPVRIWTLLSKRSMEALVEERDNRYPGQEWRVIDSDPIIPTLPERFPSIVEWQRYLKRTRLRLDSKVRRNYRR